MFYSCCQIMWLLLIHLQFQSLLKRFTVIWYNRSLGKLVSIAFRNCKMNKKYITIELKWLEEYCSLISQNNPQAWMGIWAFAAVRLALFIWTFSCSFRQLLASLHTSNTTPEKTTSRKSAVCSDILSEWEAGAGERNQMRGKSGPEQQAGSFHPNQRGNLRWEWSPGWRQRAGYWFVLAGVRHWDKLRGNPWRWSLPLNACQRAH